MSKKDELKGGLNNLFAEPTAKKAPAQQTQEEPSYTRATFILEKETVDKIKDYAYTKRITIKEAVTLMVDTFIDDYYKDPKNEELLKHK